jgi:DNA (cytosine-5)-methyltransferase 1
VARAIGLAIASSLRKEGPSSGDHGAGNQYRDEVYRALRNHAGFVSVAWLRKALGGALADTEIERRIEFIRRDFKIDVRRRGGTATYRLGEWRAFRGQEDHTRHAAFATDRLRSKIS